MFDARWDDPRDRDGDSRELEVHWVKLGRGPSDDEPRDVLEDVRERASDPRDRDRDPRDPFVEDLELPRGLERELVIDGDHQYDLSGDDTRSLATVGAFRVVAERELIDPQDDARDPRESDLDRLRDDGLVRFVSLDGNHRAVTLTGRGRHLLESHRRQPDDERRPQALYAGVSRARELSHDAQLYRAYRDVDERLRGKGASVRRVVLEQDLKREYQRWLQEHNRGRKDSDGRPDRSAREIRNWAAEHDLPYFDESVHFPDFRIEYDDRHDRHLHEDVEIVTDHYRGAHAASRAQAGFTCHGGSNGRRGGRPFDPRIAEDFI